VLEVSREKTNSHGFAGRFKNCRACGEALRQIQALAEQAQTIATPDNPPAGEESLVTRWRDELEAV